MGEQRVICRAINPTLQGGCAATRKHETASISLNPVPAWRYLFLLTRFSLVCPQEKTAAGRSAAAGQFLLVPGWYCGFAHRQQHRWVSDCSVCPREPLHVPLSKLRFSGTETYNPEAAFYSSLLSAPPPRRIWVSKHTSGAIIYLPVCVCVCCVGKRPHVGFERAERRGNFHSLRGWN